MGFKRIRGSPCQQVGIQKLVPKPVTFSESVACYVLAELSARGYRLLVRCLGAAAGKYGRAAGQGVITKVYL